MDSGFDDVDINSLKVNGVALTYIDDIEDGYLTFHLETSVTLEIDFSCIDENNSFWDKEEERYLLLRTLNNRLTKTVIIDFSGMLSVNADEEDKIATINEICEIEIDESRFGISIDIDDNDKVDILHSSIEDEYDEGEYIIGAYNTCPDCGRKINFENDGGNGFCWNCAHKH